MFPKISWCSWWSSNIDAKSTFEIFLFYWHFLHQFIIFSKYLGCRITVCALWILMLFFLKVHNFFRKAQVCLLFSQSGWRQYSWSMISSELLSISTFLHIHELFPYLINIPSPSIMRFPLAQFPHTQILAFVCVSGGISR